jgi:signal transduction histidine kinase
MAAAAATGVGASAARVRLFLESGERAVTSPAGAILEDPTLSIPVVHAGHEIGELAVLKPSNEPLRPAERSLLDDLAAHAGFALHNVRLTADLEARADELATQTGELARSRGRIVTARDAQRRRLERELRDGVAAELGAIRDEIDADARRLATDPDDVRSSLDALGERANGALGDLRDVARGIFPPLLADQGLAAALEAHLRKLGLDASIRIDPAVADARFEPATENAVYFCCIQALQNAQRHAPGSRVQVRVDLGQRDLSFVVQDDGPGFDPTTVEEHEGMQIMRDRIAALDGALEIWSAPGRGTSVTGRIPARLPEGAPA